MEAALRRLNRSFQMLEARIAEMKRQLRQHPEIQLLERENMRLHEETAALRQQNQHQQRLIDELGTELDRAVEHLERLLEQHAQDSAGGD